MRLDLITSQNCSTCDVIAPVLLDVADEMGLEVHEHQMPHDASAIDMAMEYGVRAAPSLIVRINGHVDVIPLGLKDADKIPHILGKIQSDVVTYEE